MEYGSKWYYFAENLFIQKIDAGFKSFQRNMIHNESNPNFDKFDRNEARGKTCVIVYLKYKRCLKFILSSYQGGH